VERRGRGRRAGRRFAAFLAVVCLFAAAVIVAVVIATGTSNTAVQARRTIANDVNSAINQVQGLIGQNTK
jgi:predicted PurR-regulated permease PerM